MARDVLAAISAYSGTFSKGQRKIAEYIMKNYDKAAFMTASKLGETTGVSESTIVRFAMEIGYEGYPAMRKSLQDMITNRLTSVQRIEVTKSIIGEDNILASVLSSDIEKVKATLYEIDEEEFNRAVDTIVKAKNIYIIGMRSSSALAGFLGFYLNMLFPNVHIVNESYANDIFEQIMRIGEDDVLIAISFPRYSRKTLSAIRFSRDKNAEVISITDAETSLAAAMSTVRLYAKSNMLSFVDSLVAPLSLINALIVTIADRTDDDILRQFTELEDIWAEYQVYESNEN